MTLCKFKLRPHAHLRGPQHPHLEIRAQRDLNLAFTLQLCSVCSLFPPQPVWLQCVCVFFCAPKSRHEHLYARINN